MRMDYFEQLITIVESRNMSEAAMKLNMAQPTLSTSMKALKTSWGLRFLKKAAGEISLTPLGEEVYKKGEGSIQQEN